MTSKTSLHQFDELETAVRHGVQPNCPSLLYNYLQLGDRRARRHPKMLEHKVYERMFKTLLDTISDPLVCRHWRYACLDNINRPLIQLQRCAETPCQHRYVIHLYNELAITSQYFLN